MSTNIKFQVGDFVMIGTIIGIICNVHPRKRYYDETYNIFWISVNNTIQSLGTEWYSGELKPYKGKTN